MSEDQIRTFVTAWTSAEQRGDVDALDTMLADDFSAIGPLGFVLAKPDWLDRHATRSMVYDSFVVEDPVVRRYGTAVIVTGRQHSVGRYRGHPAPGALRNTLVLTDDEAGLRLRHLQMSFIAGTPGAPPIPGAARIQDGPAAS